MEEPFAAPSAVPSPRRVEKDPLTAQKVENLETDRKRNRGGGGTAENSRRVENMIPCDCTKSDGRYRQKDKQRGGGIAEK